MKQFSLEEYLKNPSRKVITRDGRDVRIICTNKRGDRPVVALVLASDNTEVTFFYKSDGFFYTDGINNRDDLMFASTKKEGWVNVYNSNGNIYCRTLVFSSEKEARLVGEAYESYVATCKIEWEE